MPAAFPEAYLIEELERARESTLVMWPGRPRRRDDADRSATPTLRPPRGALIDAPVLLSRWTDAGETNEYLSNAGGWLEHEEAGLKGYGDSLASPRQSNAGLFPAGRLTLSVRWTARSQSAASGDRVSKAD